VGKDSEWNAESATIEHVSFRNRLRNEAAAAYVRLKKDLAQRFRNDRERYTEAKTDFIRSFLESP
jgi:GrpB-like predicted nucleotidyltransferase (UPF0157 family)